jgi:hypothetical protein
MAYTDINNNKEHLGGKMFALAAASLKDKETRSNQSSFIYESINRYNKKKRTSIGAFTFMGVD